jgi:hypothetical protein
MPTFIRKSAKKITRKPVKKFVIKKPSASMPFDITGIESQDEAVARVENPLIHQRAEETIDNLNKLLTKPSSKDSVAIQDENESMDNAIFEEGSGEPQDFNGVSDLHEQEELYSEALDYERKKKKVVEEQVRLLEIEHQKEKRVLEHEIRNLKNELHRTAPIQDNKFFSLSKELREAISDIEKIASFEGIDLARIVVKPSEEKLSPLAADAIQQIPYQAPVTVVSSAPPPSTSSPAEAAVPTVTTPAPSVQESKPVVKPPEPPVEKKALPKQKMMITGAVVTVLILTLGSFSMKTIFNKPKVDQKIVDKYLSEQSSSGQVAGASTDSNSTSQQEVDPSQSNVTFEESVWTEFNDPQFGIILQYPKNAVKAIRTDSNVTFIRKTGYLFKVQRIETSLTVDEYWKQIKATSLNYSSKADKFKNKTALKLELEDMADYPGDRYLVKEGDFIYDIWYATPSNNFSKDDIQRAEKMLSSLSIVSKK